MLRCFSGQIYPVKSFITDQWSNVFVVQCIRISSLAIQCAILRSVERATAAALLHGLVSFQNKTRKMNAKSYTLQISVEEKQIDDVLLSLLHTILFHRTTGKFSYQKEGSYTIGTLGLLDTDCSTVDLTYIRCNSKPLDQTLRRTISQFKEALIGNPAAKCGTVILEFYQKKKARWPFGVEFISWEIWNITLAISRTKGELERQRFREKVAETVSEKIIEIAQAINRPDYVPKMPNQSELGNVFDTTYTNIQPYLFKIHFQMSNDVSPSVGSTMRKLIRDTFSY